MSRERVDRRCWYNSYSSENSRAGAGEFVGEFTMPKVIVSRFIHSAASIVLTGADVRIRYRRRRAIRSSHSVGICCPCCSRGLDRKGRKVGVAVTAIHIGGLRFLPLPSLRTLVMGEEDKAMMIVMIRIAVAGARCANLISSPTFTCGARSLHGNVSAG